MRSIIENRIAKLQMLERKLAAQNEQARQQQQEEEEEKEPFSS
jgi:hypothetical protein